MPLQIDLSDTSLDVAADAMCRARALTTVLKLAATALDQEGEGRALVIMLDHLLDELGIAEDTLLARRLIGVGPEHVPLKENL